MVINVRAPLTRVKVREWAATMTSRRPVRVAQTRRRRVPARPLTYALRDLFAGAADLAICGFVQGGSHDGLSSVGVGGRVASSSCAPVVPRGLRASWLRSGPF